MSTSWEGILDDLERELAVVLAAADGDETALSSLTTTPQRWTPPRGLGALPEHLLGRAQELSAQHDHARRTLADLLRDLRPQRAVARKIDTAVRTPAYLDVRA